MIKYSQNFSRHVRVTVSTSSLQMARQTKLSMTLPNVFTRGLKFVAQLPSETTTVLLRRLPLSATQESLKAAVESVNSRKVEIEPGFVVVLNPFIHDLFVVLFF